MVSGGSAHDVALVLESEIQSVALGAEVKAHGAAEGRVEIQPAGSEVRLPASALTGLAFLNELCNFLVGGAWGTISPSIK